MHLALPPTRFSIRLDGGAPVEREARSVVVGNSGLLPGGFSLLPDARLDDGLLDVGVLAPHGPFGWPRLATRVLTRSRHQDRMLERFQARKVEVTTRTSLPREVDGELVTAGRSLTVTVQPGALTVRMPALTRLEIMPEAPTAHPRRTRGGRATRASHGGRPESAAFVRDNLFSSKLVGKGDETKCLPGMVGLKHGRASYPDGSSRAPR
jgi:hypothetical protein